MLIIKWINKHILLKNKIRAELVEAEFYKNGFKPIIVTTNTHIRKLLKTIFVVLLFSTLIPLLFIKPSNKDLLAVALGFVLFLISLLVIPISIIVHEFSHMVILNLNKCILSATNRTFCVKEISKTKYYHALLAPLYIVPMFFVIVGASLILVFDLNPYFIVYYIGCESIYNIIGATGDLSVLTYLRKHYSNEDILFATSAKDDVVLIKKKQ